MKRIIVMVMLTLPVWSSAQDAIGLLQQVKAKLGQVSNYVAEGNMKTSIPFVKIADAAVTVYFKQPDQFRVHRANGISILPKGGVQGSLHAILSEKDFTPVPGGYSTVNGRKLAVVKLLPTAEQSDIVLITLYVEEKTALVWRTTSTTRNNGTYETQLSYGKHAALGLPDQVTFIFNTTEFKLPKAMSVEYDAGQAPKPDAAKKDNKGSITITYSKYTVNKPIPESVFK